MITYQAPFFYLTTDNTTYVLRVTPDDVLSHVYYGKKITPDDLSYFRLDERMGFTAFAQGKDGLYSNDLLPQEYPTFGCSDFRSPALMIEGVQGRRINSLRYRSHEIVSGRAELSGLPYLNTGLDGVQSLVITLFDEVTDAEILLHYVVFPHCDLIARHAVISNPTAAPMQIRKADSLSLDLPRADMDFLSLQGGWCRERYPARRPICQGTVSVESRRGSSSAQLNPFAALMEKNATETSGDVYGFAFVYSSDFRIAAEVSQTAKTRVQVGLNPETFSWKLEPNESFTTPEALMTYSAEGLGRMSRNFHKACRAHLGKSAQKGLRHPIVVNNWEATYFDINEEKLEKLIENSKGLGIDTFVLDDGWFGHRDFDDKALGDWYVFAEKFPHGLQHIAQKCREHGMRFGLWFEPEMVCENSDLFRAHPDWFIHCDGLQPHVSRTQFVLDMSRPEVVDNIYAQVSKVLRECDITYVKWDCNRHTTDNGSAALPADRQGEHTHRQMLGVYDLMRRLTEDFPHILFEGCSGGGGRYDFGILYYMPQIWTSDDSDAIERLKIQYGTSYAYPPASMVGHVSACPNHQTNRTTPFATRGEVAQMCNYGYELDIGRLSEDERAQIVEQTKRHCMLEPLIANGEYYRLLSPFDGPFCAWELVSEAKDRAYLMVAQQRSLPNPSTHYVRAQGLDPQARYCVEQLGVTLGGDTLMNVGLPMAMPFGVYPVLTFDIVRVKE